MKTVVFVTTSDLSGKSGHNIATKEMIGAFCRHQSLNVVLVCPSPQGELPAQISENVASTYYIRTQTSGSISEHVLTQVSMIPAFLSALRNESPDAVVTRHSPTMLVPPLLTKAYGVPYVVLARGLGHKRLKFSWLLTKIFWLNVRLADQVYPAYSEVQSRVDAIRTSSQSKSRLFTNAVDPEKLSPLDRSEARDALDMNISESDFVVGFVGSLKNWHRLDALILALNHLPEDTKVVIVGKGPKEIELKQLVEDENLGERVLFTGFVDHNEVNVYISASDVAYGAIDPDHPGNAIKCYEYLSCERPVITDGRREFEFVDENELGVLVDEITPETIAAAITSLRSLSDDERASMGEDGREYVLANHTWDQLAKLVYDRLRD